MDKRPLGALFPASVKAPFKKTTGTDGDIMKAGYPKSFRKSKKKSG